MISALVSSELIAVLFIDNLSISTIPVPFANILTLPLVSEFVKFPFDDVVAAKSVYSSEKLSLALVMAVRNVSPVAALPSTPVSIINLAIIL